MENWIEPERAKLTSFQEDGLIRQGVLETMEPLGTRPKPAMIKKLVGIGREASPTSTARGKLTGKKIVLKRKPGNSAMSSLGTRTPGTASAAPDPLSGTQSPTPTPSTTVATPQPDSSPIITPTMTKLPRASPEPILLPQNSSPCQAPPTTRNAHIVPVPTSDVAMEHKFSSKGRSGSGNPRFPPAALSTSSLTDPFPTDPVKQSIEEPQSLQNLPTTPRSIASTYYSDDICRRESSLQSISKPNMLTKPTVDDDTVEQSQCVQQRTGPIYIASELARIIEHKEVVKTAIDNGVEEALRHFQYVDAWALQFMYDDKEEDPRFLLLTEAVFTQTATPQALGEWARELHAFKLLGMKGNAAVRHFVPEARADTNYSPPQALPAEYRDLITMDLSTLRDPTNYKEEPQVENANREGSEAVRQPEGGVSRTQAEAEAEHERVATPPRKRQKTSSHNSPMARKASHSARASAMKGHGNVNNGGNIAQSPLRHRQRLLSEDSDLSSLSSLGSLSPSPELASWARPVDQRSQDAAGSKSAAAAFDVNGNAQRHKQSKAVSIEGVAEALVTNGTSKAAPDEAAASAQPIAGGRRRAPARARRGGPNNLAPEPGPGPVPRPSPGGPNFTSKSKVNPNSDLDSRNPSPDTHQTTNDDFIAHTNNSSTIQPLQPSKRSKRGMPNFDPQFCLEQGDEGTVRRRVARNTTLRLTEEARIKGDSFTRSRTIDVPSPPERPVSSQSSLSSLSALEDESALEGPVPEAVAPIARVAPASARTTRSAKRMHDDVEDEATPFSLDFPPEAGMGTVATSRAGTPRPNKKQRTGGRRLKLS